ncbi:hypothetical protein CR205_14555 [Alteribacter lacisalsi]|uniref:Uncharacterized protein n=1 Tax=Alteribacter lacisalsi TaxID=2045244 RepID=A0A2W0H4Y3_9BACI|nr:hypothetical protein [Alteribacter lacisalsi]PYZ96894.1 hypothetical protein CR205_14555 [Alteribacter lacisalsi]
MLTRLSLKHADTSRVAPFLIAGAMIIGLSAFLLPFIAVMVLQDMLYFSRDHWIFLRPTAAYIFFGAGMLWMAAVLLSALFTKMWADRKDRTYNLTTVHLLLFLLAGPFFVFSVMHYTYLDDSGAHTNPLFAAGETTVMWDDVTEVVREIDPANNEILSYTFRDSEDAITLPFGQNSSELRGIVRNVVNGYELEVTEVERER